MKDVAEKGRHTVQRSPERVRSTEQSTVGMVGLAFVLWNPVLIAFMQ
jgi:hypothetical protein